MMVTPWIGQALRYGLPFCGLLAMGATVGAKALGIPAWVLIPAGLAAAFLGVESWEIQPTVVCMIALVAALLLMQQASSDGPKRLEGHARPSWWLW